MFKMSKVISIFPRLLLLWMLTINSLWAGDEDMLSPYTQFDPETGFFIPIDPQPVQHESQDSTMAVDPNTQSSSSTNVDESKVEESQESIGPTIQSLVMVVGIVLLLTAMIFWFRKNRNNTM